MKASVAMTTIAFVVLGLSTSAYAHNVGRVRRELRSQGYDQIEFTRTKFPVWVNACRGGERLHLHVDWYGKIKKKTRTGSCPMEAENTVETEAKPKDEPTTIKTVVENENSTISAASMETAKTVPENPVGAEPEPNGEPKNLGCKKFYPAVGMTVTVPCE